MIKTSNIHTKTWYLFSEMLPVLYRERRKLNKAKSTHFQRAAINSSILLHLAATLEGSVSSLLYTTLTYDSNYKSARENDDLNLIRLFKNQLDILQKSTWNSLSLELSKTILGFPLSEIYKEWIAIKHLFAFRNILAHGGLIISTLEKNSKSENTLLDSLETTEEFMTKRELFNFLHQKNLIDDPKDYNVFVWRFINSEVVDFFHLHVKEFLTILYDKYETKFKLHAFLETDKTIIQRL